MVVHPLLGPCRLRILDFVDRRQADFSLGLRITLFNASPLLRCPGRQAATAIAPNGADPCRFAGSKLPSKHHPNLAPKNRYEGRVADNHKTALNVWERSRIIPKHLLALTNRQRCPRLPTHAAFLRTARHQQRRCVRGRRPAGGQVPGDLRNFRQHCRLGTLLARRLGQSSKTRTDTVRAVYRENAFLQLSRCSSGLPECFWKLLT